MKKIVIPRLVNTEDGVFGAMIYNGLPFAVTLECPWLNNAPNISCIPPGIYICKRSIYHRGGYGCFEVQNVPDRWLIKTHKANWKKDIKGCIGVAEQYEILNGKPAIAASGKGFSEYMALMEGEDEHELEIVNYFKNEIPARISA